MYVLYDRVRRWKTMFDPFLLLNYCALSIRST